MRALRVDTLSDDLSGVSLADRPMPERGAEQLLVRVRAASLNFPDLLMTRGGYQLKPPLPFTLGMEMSGEVIEAAGEFAVGERVVAGTRLGGFAEFVAVDAATARRVPDGMSFADAASVGAAYLTAWVGLVAIGRMQVGEWVLVHGATGGVGLAAVDLAIALGAKVIATSRSPEKLAALAGMYPDVETLPAGGFREEVKTLTGGGADLIYDPVGGDVFDESTRCIGWGGRLLVIGFTSGRIPSVAANIPLIKGFSVVGVRAGEYGRRDPAAGRAASDAVWHLAADRRIRPHVHATYKLADWRAAFEAMAASRQLGKIVIEP